MFVPLFQDETSAVFQELRFHLEIPLQHIIA